MTVTPKAYLPVNWWASHRCKPSSGRYQRKGMLGRKPTRLPDVKRLMLDKEMLVPPVHSFLFFFYTKTQGKERL